LHFACGSYLSLQAAKRNKIPFRAERKGDT
jgi:hypothetical protein